jgi:hypothetical protein
VLRRRPDACNRLSGFDSWAMLARQSGPAHDCGWQGAMVPSNCRNCRGWWRRADIAVGTNPLGEARRARRHIYLLPSRQRAGEEEILEACVHHVVLFGAVDLEQLGLRSWDPKLCTRSDEDRCSLIVVQRMEEWGTTTIHTGHHKAAPFKRCHSPPGTRPYHSPPTPPKTAFKGHHSRRAPQSGPNQEVPFTPGHKALPLTPNAPQDHIQEVPFTPGPTKRPSATSRGPPCANSAATAPGRTLPPTRPRGNRTRP